MPRERPKREMDIETRSYLAEFRRRKRGVRSDSERRRAEAEAEIERWNTRHAIGIEVVVTLDDGTEVPSRTVSAAALMCDSAVVWLEGFSACYLLSRVRPA